MADEAKSLRTRVAEMEKASKAKASKVWTNRKTVNMIAEAEQGRSNCAEHTARLAQLEGGLHELKGRLDFSERCNNVADSSYSMLCDECDSIRCQIASGGEYS